MPMPVRGFVEEPGLRHLGADDVRRLSLRTCDRYTVGFAWWLHFTRVDETRPWMRRVRWQTVHISRPCCEFPVFFASGL